LWTLALPGYNPRNEKPIHPEFFKGTMPFSPISKHNTTWVMVYIVREEIVKMLLKKTNDYS
jgi:2-polyprenyl-3-methyl-5-hydroxy-6-metoxy-1,4-benzoquinol methylase